MKKESKKSAWGQTNGQNFLKPNVLQNTAEAVRNEIKISYRQKAEIIEWKKELAFKHAVPLFCVEIPHATGGDDQGCTREPYGMQSELLDRKIPNPGAQKEDEDH